MARMEVAPVRSQLIVLPFRLGVCPACKHELQAEAHLRIADDVELRSIEEWPVPVGMQPIGVRISHDCVPGPTRGGS